MQGCDASVLLDGSASGPSEQEAPPNETLRPEAFEIIEDLRELVHKQCGRVVSCADITALAAREAVFQVNMLAQPLYFLVSLFCEFSQFSLFFLFDQFSLLIQHKTQILLILERVVIFTLCFLYFRTNW
jgi:hypothetical protein